MFAKDNPYTGYVGSVYAIYHFFPDFDLIGGISGFSNNKNKNKNKNGMAVDLQLGLNIPFRSNTFINLGVGGSYLDYNERIYTYNFSYGVSYNITQRIGVGIYDLMRFKPGRGILNQQVMLGLTIKFGSINNSLVRSGNRGQGLFAYENIKKQRGDKITALKAVICRDFDCDNQKNVIKTSNVLLLKKHRFEIASLLNDTNIHLLLNSDISNLSNNLKEYFVNRVGVESSKIDLI